MLASNDNKYGMYLTPEEMQNHALIQQLEMQQQLALQQAKQYAHGWHDPRALQAVPTSVPYAQDPVTGQTRWQSLESIKLPKPKLYQILIGAAVFLLVVSIYLKVTL